MADKDRDAESAGTRIDSPEDGAKGRQEAEVGILDLAVVLAKHKKTIFIAPLIGAAITAVITFIVPAIYTGKASIMPPQQQSSAAALLLGQLGALAGGGAGLSLKNPNDLYVGMIESRTIADKLIQRFDLQKYYDQDTLDRTREKLDDDTNVVAGPDGLIRVEVDNKDPVRAAEIANAYVDELDHLSQNLAITEAAQRRLFFERQLKQTKDALTTAELKLQATQEKSGLILPAEQGRATIDVISGLRAQIAAKEVQIESTGSFATNRNPDYVRMQQELAGLRVQLKKLEKGGGSGDVLVSPSQVPKVGLDYERAYRDVKYYEALFELLAKQFELAKVDEARDSAVLQIVDRAVPPQERSKPKRLLITALALIAFGFFTVCWVVLKEWALQARGPDAEKFQALKRYAVVRRR